MIVIFHKNAETVYSNMLLQTVFSVVADEKVHVTYRTKSFVDILLKYRSQMPTLVIQVSSTEDVMKIKSLSDILDGLFLILACDNNKEGLLIASRQLFPRLLISSEKDLNLVTAVLEKQLEKECRRSPPPTPLC